MKRKHRPIGPPSMGHPSGRPIVKEKRGVTSLSNIPDDEPLTPGLRRQELQEAMGFVHDFTSIYDEEEDFDYTRETERGLA